MEGEERTVHTAIIKDHLGALRRVRGDGYGVSISTAIAAATEATRGGHGGLFVCHKSGLDRLRTGIEAVYQGV